MKGLYIDLIDDKKEKNLIGVKKKILGQINGFKSLNVNMSTISIEDGIILVDGIKSNYNINGINSYFKRSNLFFKILRKCLLNEIINNDFIYIRYVVCNYEMLRLVKCLSKNSKKVFLEIPTYPYIDEYKKNIKTYIFLKIDYLILKCISKFVYKFVMTNDMNKLFSADTINIFNGIDMNSVNIIKKKRDYTNINLIGLANVNIWHGYDRVIRGISDYYKLGGDKKINFYIVGEGIENNRLKELSKKLEVEKYVKFLGVKYGKELDELFCTMDIGVSSLALFRAGGGHDPIKTKEYLAKGIPVLLGYNDRALIENLPFIFEVDANDSPIDIKKLILDYENNSIDHEEIRQYAERNLSWSSQVKKVISSI